MTTWLKQSTATDVELGPFVDDTDGKTAETGLTISQADCQLIKNGGAAAQKNDSTSATHLAGGHYKVPLNTTDTNTLGRLRLYVNESGALPVWRDFMVLPANIYDSLVGGSDYLDVSAVQIAGSAVSTTTAQIGVNVVQISADSTAADNAEAFFDGTGYAGTNNTIPTVTNVTNAVSANVTQISGDSTAADNAESFFDGTGYAGTNNTIPIVTAVTGNIGGNVAGSVGSVTGNVGGNVTGSVGSLAAQAKTDVNAEVVDALATDTYAELGAVPAATSTLKDKINWLFMLARNARTTTATTDAVRNDANSANVATSTLNDDGTTFTRGEYS